MKQFLILHEGFEKPSPEDMNQWKNWFELIADKQVDRGGLRDAVEITSDETKELPFGPDALTGYTIIEAENLEEAVTIAEKCPVVKSTRVFEIKK